MCKLNLLRFGHSTGSNTKFDFMKPVLGVFASILLASTYWADITIAQVRPKPAQKIQPQQQVVIPPNENAEQLLERGNAFVRLGNLEVLLPAKSEELRLGNLEGLLHLASIVGKPFVIV